MQPECGSLHDRTFMIMPGGTPLIKTAGLSGSFQYEGNNSVVAETLEEYELASAEAAYENRGEQAPIVFMELYGEIQGSENTPPLMERKLLSLPFLTGTENSRWYTAAVCMSI